MHTHSKRRHLLEPCRCGNGTFWFSEFFYPFSSCCLTFIGNPPVGHPGLRRWIHTAACYCRVSAIRVRSPEFFPACRSFVALRSVSFLSFLALLFFSLFSVLEGRSDVRRPCALVYIYTTSPSSASLSRGVRLCRFGSCASLFLSSDISCCSHEGSSASGHRHQTWCVLAPIPILFARPLLTASQERAPSSTQ